VVSEFAHSDFVNESLESKIESSKGSN